jgi:hypothetical protein
VSDGTRGFSTASWHHDIVTVEGKEQDLVISLDNLKASMGPRPAPSHLKLDGATIKEMGFMLSLKLSDGSPYPIETYGNGIFPFLSKFIP